MGQMSLMCFILLTIAYSPKSTFTQIILDIEDIETPCFTPSNQNGLCKSLRKCPALLALLRSSSKNPEVAKHLQLMQCGVHEGIPKVCCPIDGSNGLRQESSDAKPEESPKFAQTSHLFPDVMECGHSSEVRTVSGNMTEIYEFPWMALLEYDTPTGKKILCGGALITSKYILTAAHCIKGKEILPDFQLNAVILGEWDTQNDPDCTDDATDKLCADPPKKISIESTAVHGSYDPNDPKQYHDIALIRLTKNITFTYWILPICLPIFDQRLLDKNFDGFDMHLVGWGKTKLRSKSEIKLKSRLKIIPRALCKARYEDFQVTLGPGQICAGGSSMDACNGDSGGPLVYDDAFNKTANWYIYGVESFGMSKCGTDGLPKVYTNVGSYVTWIMSKIKE